MQLLCSAAGCSSHPRIEFCCWSIALCADAKVAKCISVAKNSICLMHYTTEGMAALAACLPDYQSRLSSKTINLHRFSHSASLIPSFSLYPQLPLHSPLHPSSDLPLLLLPLPSPSPPPSLEQLPVWSSWFQPQPAPWVFPLKPLFRKT